MDSICLMMSNVLKITMCFGDAQAVYIDNTAGFLRFFFFFYIDIYIHVHIKWVLDYAGKEV